MCTSPVPIYSEKDYKYISCPCGKCTECRLNYTKMWGMRVVHELQNYDEACFITLTYDDLKLPYDWHPDSFPLEKSELQKFFKRLRKYLGDKKIKYFACGEYGGKFHRPHFHAIIFGWRPEDTDVYGNSQILSDIWKYGFVKVGNANFRTARYVASYIVKKKKGKDGKAYYEENNLNPEFVLMSQGLGKSFCLKHAEQIKKLGYILFNGYKCGIPRYYADKIYTTEKDKQKRKEYLNEYFEKCEQDSCKRFKADYDRYLIFAKRFNYRYISTFRDFVGWCELKERTLREERLKYLIARRRNE